jgi:hypothetical protein
MSTVLHRGAPDAGSTRPASQALLRLPQSLVTNYLLRLFGTDALVARPFGKRFILVLILAAGLAVQFWTQSRYPSPNEKPIASGAMQLEDSLSFEALILGTKLTAAQLNDAQRLARERWTGAAR